MSAGYRKFNGKLYEKETTVWSKREAQNVAVRLRSKGINARIVVGSRRNPFAFHQPMIDNYLTQ